MHYFRSFPSLCSDEFSSRLKTNYDYVVTISFEYGYGYNIQDEFLVLHRSFEQFRDIVDRIP